MQEFRDYISPLLIDIKACKNSPSNDLVDNPLSKQLGELIEKLGYVKNTQKNVEQDLSPLIAIIHDGLQTQVEDFSTNVGILEATVNKLSDLYRLKLEEDRNFWTFVLTVSTIILWPASFFTGYWGMNFDNMSELNAPYVSSNVQGVQIMWATMGSCYALILTVCAWAFLFD